MKITIKTAEQIADYLETISDDAEQEKVDEILEEKFVPLDELKDKLATLNHRIRKDYGSDNLLSDDYNKGREDAVLDAVHLLEELQNEM